MERAVTALGICALAFIAGATTVTFEVFPYRQFRDARLAYEALYYAMGLGRPARFVGFDDFYSRPVAVDPQGGRQDDLILVVGGPYELMSHCPRQGCLAWIVDRRGEIVHVWPMDLDALWGDLEVISLPISTDRIYPFDANLYADGDLLVSFQNQGGFPYAVGLAKFDKDGRLLWKHDGLVHHRFSVDEAGRIYAPSMRVVPNPLVPRHGGTRIECETGYVYEDLIKVFDSDGNLIREFSVFDALLESDYRGLLHYSEDRTYQHCDPTHLNAVQVLPARLAVEYPELEAGDLLVSMRTNNVLAVLDGQTAKVKWLLAGRTVGQHSPHFIGGNRIRVFDNMGGPGAENYSRLVEIDLATNALTPLFPLASTEPALEFGTELAGAFDLHQDQRHALVALTNQGRIVELDLSTADVTWQYVNTHLDPDDGKARRMGVTTAYYVTEPAFLGDWRSRP